MATCDQITLREVLDRLEQFGAEHPDAAAMWLHTTSDGRQEGWWTITSTVDPLTAAHRIMEQELRFIATECLALLNKAVNGDPLCVWCLFLTMQDRVRVFDRELKWPGMQFGRIPTIAKASALVLKAFSRIESTATVIKQDSSKRVGRTPQLPQHIKLVTLWVADRGNARSQKAWCESKRISDDKLRYAINQVRKAERTAEIQSLLENLDDSIK